MSKFHSMVSRRDFMKGLGFGAAGLGAAAAAAPAFHDLDELMSSPTSSRKRAWWIKEVDEPTVEIDWSMVKRHHGRHSTQSAPVVARYVGADAYNAMKRTEKSSADRCKDNEPGYRLRDQALASANSGLRVATLEQKFGQIKATTPEARGVPNWTGTPEEATKMLRAAMVFFGIADIGTAEINDHHQHLIGLTGENLSMSYYDKFGDDAPTTATKPLVFSNQPKFSFDSATGITYLPNVPLYGITYQVPQDSELNRCRPTTLGGVAQTRYRLREVPRACTQAFIAGLGYESMMDEPYRAIPSNAGAVLGGLSENSRHSIMSISPEYGAFGGYFDFLTTLPIAPTKPIDAGMWRFCHSCGLCADYCPSDSITKKGEAEASFDVRPSKLSPVDPARAGMRESGEFHKLGRKTYWTDMPGCAIYMRGVADCKVCWAHCVFNGASGAMVHQVVKATAAATPLFNSFFSSMHDVFGYGLKTGESIEEWWDMSLPAYGFSSTNLSKDMGY